MNDDVVGVRRLLGLQLRDHQQNRQGTVVGINHTRRAPALLMRWMGKSASEWVELTIDELDALIVASQPPQSSFVDQADSYEEEVIASKTASAGRR